MVKPMMRQRKRNNKPHWRKRPQRKLQDQPMPMPEPSVEFQNTYTFRPIETYQVCKRLDTFHAGREEMAGVVHRQMAHEMDLKLAQDEILAFDTEPDLMNCGIVVRARVDVIRPM